MGEAGEKFQDLGNLSGRFPMPTSGYEPERDSVRALTRRRRSFTASDHQNVIKMSLSMAE